MKKICVLLGSPRKNGNTNALMAPFINRLEKDGNQVVKFTLYGMNVKPCLACRECQKDWNVFGCVQDDDMHEIADSIMKSDIIVIASPIYSWYCTPPVKCIMDRLVYGMNKYYGEEKGPSIWAGKSLAIVTTCGYRPEKGADLWEEGVKRYCKHSQLKYTGMLVERHMGYDTIFMDEEKEKHAIEFAEEIMNG